MPPKSKAASIPTIEELHDAHEKIDKAEKPADADFVKIISATKGDSSLKSLAARLIPRYIEKFPKHNKDALAAQIELTKDESTEVKIYAVQGLKEFVKIDVSASNIAIFNALGDSDTFKSASQYVTSQFEGAESEEFKKLFFESISKVSAEAQAKMINIIIENYKFTEENVDQLVEVLSSAFTVDVLTGLRLLAKNKAIVPEAKKAELEAQLISNLEGSIESNFTEVCDQLLITIMDFTRTFGDDTNRRLYGIIASHVLPKINDLSAPTKIKIIQEIAENAKLIPEKAVLTQLYENVFMQFPNHSGAKFNFSLIEATLFAFFRLARRFTAVAGQCLGTVLVLTGQPDEGEGVSEDAGKRGEFEARVRAIGEVAALFHEKSKETLGELKKAHPKGGSITDEEKAQIKEAKIATRCGSNVRYFCKILLLPNFVTHKPADNVSWHPPTKKPAPTKKPQYARAVRGSPRGRGSGRFTARRAIRARY